MASVDIEKDGDSDGGIKIAELVSERSSKEPVKSESTLEVNAGYELQLHHVVEVMLEAEEPQFSVRRVKSELKSSPSKQTVRRRLDELAELGVVETDTYENLTLYSIRDRRSKYPVPGDIVGGEDVAEARLRDLILFRAPEELRTLVAFAAYAAIYLMLIGVVLNSFDVPVPVTSSNEYVTAAVLLIISAYPLLAVQWLVTQVRDSFS